MATPHREYQEGPQEQQGQRHGQEEHPTAPQHPEEGLRQPGERRATLGGASAANGTLTSSPPESSSRGSSGKLSSQKKFTRATGSAAHPEGPNVGLHTRIRARRYRVHLHTDDGAVPLEETLEESLGKLNGGSMDTYVTAPYGLKWSQTRYRPAASKYALRTSGENHEHPTGPTGPQEHSKTHIQQRAPLREPQAPPNLSRPPGTPPPSEAHDAAHPAAHQPGTQGAHRGPHQTPHRAPRRSSPQEPQCPNQPEHGQKPLDAHPSIIRPPGPDHQGQPPTEGSHQQEAQHPTRKTPQKTPWRRPQPHHPPHRIPPPTSGEVTQLKPNDGA
ncbi:calcium homeostasis endoplasmic reticulum protein-like [Procambarus clarkii]|uniref:calcium homeostasis endoplasmic reticulum protein-like n=1 Tax=Procambarus clarkii TaxID=6728 RepID=UPI0037448ED8